MTPEQRRIRGADAKSLLDNPLLKEAFEAVGGYLDTQAMTCDPDNKEKAARIIISKQILGAIKRELSRAVEDGAIAEIQMQEVEQRKRFGVFRR